MANGLNIAHAMIQHQQEVIPVLFGDSVVALETNKGIDIVQWNIFRVPSAQNILWSTGEPSLGWNSKIIVRFIVRPKGRGDAGIHHQN